RVERDLGERFRADLRQDDQGDGGRVPAEDGEVDPVRREDRPDRLGPAADGVQVEHPFSDTRTGPPLPARRGPGRPKPPGESPRLRVVAAPTISWPPRG